MHTPERPDPPAPPETPAGRASGTDPLALEVASLEATFGDAAPLSSGGGEGGDAHVDGRRAVTPNHPSTEEKP
ncbi:MAG: hypothetical protein KDB94_12680 [Acidobacteria bacterium]|nr:hypothetical protein [Acidobacteriota bacterium]MCB9378850.1 hypothetical protein [Holophagales bacterium]